MLWWDGLIQCAADVGFWNAGVIFANLDWGGLWFDGLVHRFEMQFHIRIGTILINKSRALWGRMFMPNPSAVRSTASRIGWRGASLRMSTSETPLRGT